MEGKKKTKNHLEKDSWRRTVEKERNKAGWKSWGVAKAVAQDRKCWSDSVKAFCPYVLA